MPYDPTFSNYDGCSDEKVANLWLPSRKLVRMAKPCEIYKGPTHIFVDKCLDGNKLAFGVAQFPVDCGISSKITPIRTIGGGGEGKVELCICEGAFVCRKTMYLSQFNEQRCRIYSYVLSLEEQYKNNVHGLTPIFGFYISKDLKTFHIISEYSGLPDMFDIFYNAPLSATPSCNSILNILLTICQCVEKVHSAGFVHRDIKLENTLLDKNGNISLCDSLTCIKCPRKIPFRPRHMVKGTHQPPEFRNIEDRTIKYYPYATDVFSMGCDIEGFCDEIFDRTAEPCPAAGRYRGIDRNIARSLDVLSKNMKHKDPLRRPSMSSVVSNIELLIYSNRCPYV